ncbi:MAG: glycerophosphodiester phosphodiesterase, partial [Solirubrobacteraceae bacterium]
QDRAAGEPLRRVGHAVVRAGDQLELLAERLAAASWQMVELDVLPLGGELLVAHDAADLEHPSPLRFADALVALRELLAPEVEFDVDLKAPGFERAVVRTLREADLMQRTLISSMHPSSLRAVRVAEPSLRLGLSVPRARRDHLAHPVTRPLALAGLAALRRALPRRAAAALGSGLADAIMAHWAVVTPALVGAVRGRGGELYAWTVDDPRRVRELEALGVTGVIANDATVFQRAGVPA